ncbi:MAG TPA: nitroreductase family protein [Actinopolymorphaceae bacterium]
METWDAIRSRRDVRTFEDRAVPPEHLTRILEAGRRSPSASNWQPWDFVVVTDRDRLEALARVRQSARHVARSAATIALVASIPRGAREERLLYFDLGQVAMSMMLEASDLGIGAGHASVGDQDMARSVLGFPDDKFCAHLIVLGYPSDRPLIPVQRPDRRAYDDVVHMGRW